MSTASAQRARRPHVDPTPSAPATPMRIVSSRSQRRARPKTIYALVVVGGLFAVLLGQLTLSIALGDGAYQIAKLQSSARDLDRSKATLTEAIETLSSPQNLAANAQALGMVPNTAPVYLRLSDGAVLGSPAAASGAAGAIAQLVANKTLTGVQTLDPSGAAVAPAVTPAAGTAGTGTNGLAPVTTTPNPAATTAVTPTTPTGTLPPGTIAGPVTH